MSDIEKWAEELAETRLDSREKQRATEAKILSDRQVLKEWARPTWNDLREAIPARIKALNKAMRGEEMLRMAEGESSDTLSFSRVEDGKLYTLTFSEERGLVTTPYGKYSLVPHSTNRVIWNCNGGSYETDHVAESIVTAAFRETK